MSPLYDCTGDPEVLFERDGFQVSKYKGIYRPELMHRCWTGLKERRREGSAEFVQKMTVGWRCSYCYQVCPDEVVAVWTMMEPATPRPTVVEYYHTVKFSGLANAVSDG
jgi:hypothetical protein